MINNIPNVIIPNNVNTKAFKSSVFILYVYLYVINKKNRNKGINLKLIRLIPLIII